MYGIVAGVFAVFTGILFGFRVKRRSGESKIEKQEGSPV
jgi:vacuolar-type H+-ATPase subunit I/STV1